MKNKHTTIATLCFPITSERILLGKKKLRLGAGWWNGFGGKVEKDETVTDAACREVEEECGLLPFKEDLEYVARVLFKYPEEHWDVHIFFARAWTGEICESDEMCELTWFLHKDIPYANMGPSDLEWLPRVLDGKKVLGDVSFSKDKEIADMKFSQVRSLTLP